MQNLLAFSKRMRATAQYYPIEYEVAIWNADTRQWTGFGIKMDQCYEKDLAAAALADGGRISRRNGFFTN